MTCFKMADVSHNRQCLVACLFLTFLAGCSARYQPNWKSIDSRPLPSWYDESKVGIFLHWGVFSVPSFHSEWFWHYWKDTKLPDVVAFMEKNYRPDWTYADFAEQFTAEFFNPDQWSDIFKASGARYVVLTTKHHEGFTNWPSKYSWTWNSMSIGPKRDLVGSLAESIRRKTDLHFGLYHSLFEWFNPLFLQDEANNWTTTDFSTRKSIPELHELVNIYKPDIVWSDGVVGPATYWNATGFLAWLYNDSPIKEKVVTNDRWGAGTICHHGGFLTCDDRYSPGVLQKRKWENALTIDKKSWGYRRNASLSDYMSMDELIDELVKTVSCGGNILINVGPTKDGRIVPIYEERLRQLGQWLKVNGEAIYSSVPWTHQNDSVTPNIWYTSKKTQSGSRDVYAIALDWPEKSTLTLTDPVSSRLTRVTLLGYGKSLSWTAGPKGAGMIINIPIIPFNRMPCDWAWVFKLEKLQK